MFCASSAHRRLSMLPATDTRDGGYAAGCCRLRLRVPSTPPSHCERGGDTQLDTIAHHLCMLSKLSSHWMRLPTISACSPSCPSTATHAVGDTQLDAIARHPSMLSLRAVQPPRNTRWGTLSWMRLPSHHFGRLSKQPSHRDTTVGRHAPENASRLQKDI